jgi:phage shock protein A
MDSLERKYELLQAEATSWRSRAESLEAQNSLLAQQLLQLEARLEAAEKKNITYILPVEQKPEGRKK